MKEIQKNVQQEEPDMKEIRRQVEAQKKDYEYYKYLIEMNKGIPERLNRIAWRGTAEIEEIRKDILEQDAFLLKEQAAVIEKIEYITRPNLHWGDKYMAYLDIMFALEKMQTVMQLKMNDLQDAARMHREDGFDLTEI